MKKIISIVCAAVLLFTISMTAFADDGTTSTNQTTSGNAVQALQKRADNLTRRLEFLKFKQSLYDKRTVIRENRASERNQVIENTQLRLDIVNLLKSLKENGGTLSADVQSQLKDYNSQLKEITSALKDTKGNIKDIVTANKQNIKDMNYDAIDAAYNQIISIQQNRSDQLTKINGVLQDIKSLLSTTV